LFIPQTPNNAALKTYDIVAVRPKTEKLFQQCCAFAEADVIRYERILSTLFSR
jgi:hypothetical protein